MIKLATHFFLSNHRSQFDHLNYVYLAILGGLTILLVSKTTQNNLAVYLNWFN